MSKRKYIIVVCLMFFKLFAVAQAEFFLEIPSEETAKFGLAGKLTSKWELQATYGFSNVSIGVNYLFGHKRIQPILGLSQEFHYGYFKFHATELSIGAKLYLFNRFYILPQYEWWVKDFSFKRTSHVLSFQLGLTYSPSKKERT